jgi:hypothetical protein
MIFDLTNPKTDVKALFEDFKNWIKDSLLKVANSEQLQHLTRVYSGVKIRKKNIFFKSELVDAWIIDHLMRSGIYSAPLEESAGQFFFEDTEILLRAWVLADLIKETMWDVTGIFNQGSGPSNCWYSFRNK